jgi:hypothetical protein
MIWVASLLTFVVVVGGLIGIAVMRRKLRDDAPAHELSPDVLIAIARSHDAKLTSRQANVATRQDIPEPARSNGPFRDA